MGAVILSAAKSVEQAGWTRRASATSGVEPACNAGKRLAQPLALVVVLVLVPTCYGGKVYYASPTGLVGCAAGETGRPRWSLDVKDRFGGKGFDFVYAATPVVEDGRVFLPTGGHDAALVALDAETGRTLWKAGSDPASYCPCFPFTFMGRRRIAGCLQNSLLLVEATTSKSAPVGQRAVLSVTVPILAATPPFSRCLP